MVIIKTWLSSRTKPTIGRLRERSPRKKAVISNDEGGEIPQKKVVISKEARLRDPPGAWVLPGGFLKELCCHVEGSVATRHPLRKWVLPRGFLTCLHVAVSAKAGRNPDEKSGKLRNDNKT